MLERTVICWDGSEPADAAMEWALRRSRDTGTTAQVFDILDRGLFLGDDAALERATTQEEDRLAARLEKAAAEHPGAVADSALLVGDPLELLAAQTRPDTLVVVGTKHRSGPRTRYGWSVGARLATAAAGPVAIVPAEEPGEARARSGIVVGVDGSAVSRLAADFAAQEAEDLSQPLTIIHCWQEPLAEEPLVVPDEEFVDSQQTAHQELLDDHVLTVRDRHPGLAVEPLLLRMHAITGLRSHSLNAFEVVVGSRRLTGWKRAWLGSVSHGLVLDLAAPTIVVGPEARVAAAGSVTRETAEATLGA